MLFRDHPRNPSNQPFQLNGTPNKTKKRSNMIIFKQREEATPFRKSNKGMKKGQSLEVYSAGVAVGKTALNKAIKLKD